MTLGKVERFWASMWQEFLVRAQFDSFESARERLKLWVKYSAVPQDFVIFGQKKRFG
jgi:hypothetical protein